MRVSSWVGGWVEGGASLDSNVTLGVEICECAVEPGLLLCQVLPYWGNPHDRKVIRKFWSQVKFVSISCPIRPPHTHAFFQPDNFCPLLNRKRCTRKTPPSTW